MGIRLLHTADLHLDRPFLGLGPRRTARRAEMRRRFEEILEIAGKRAVAALLISGDLFDGPAAESGHWVKAHLAALAGQGVRIYLIPGNHDPLEQCRFYQGDFPPGVHVFKDPEPGIREDLPGVAIHGLSYRGAGRRQSPLRGLARRGDAPWQIALIHGQLRSSALIGEDYAPFEPGEIAACGLDYLALGHYHGFLDCSAGRTKAFYPGSPHRLDFSDSADRRLLLVDLDEGGIKVEPIPLPDRRFFQLAGDAARPEALYEQLIALADPEAYVRVRLSGRAATPIAGLVADLRDKFVDRFYGFEIESGEAATGAPEAQPGTVAHAFARLVSERLLESEGEETERLRLAMDYGLLALEGRQLP